MQWPQASRCTCGHAVGQQGDFERSMVCLLNAARLGAHAVELVFIGAQEGAPEEFVEIVCASACSWAKRSWKHSHSFALRVAGSASRSPNGASACLELLRVETLQHAVQRRAHAGHDAELVRAQVVVGVAHRAQAP